MTEKKKILVAFWLAQDGVEKESPFFFLKDETYAEYFLKNEKNTDGYMIYHSFVDDIEVLKDKKVMKGECLGLTTAIKVYNQSEDNVFMLIVLHHCMWDEYLEYWKKQNGYSELDHMFSLYTETHSKEEEISSDYAYGIHLTKKTDVAAVLPYEDMLLIENDNILSLEGTFKIIFFDDRDKEVTFN
jgi:hypothetical protein